MSNSETTEWALGMGGWWRRERGAILRVRTRAMPPRDEDETWTAEVDCRRRSIDAPTLYNSNGRTAAFAKAWCDQWVGVVLREDWR
jgi:hypothetical protein